MGKVLHENSLHQEGGAVEIDERRSAGWGGHSSLSASSTDGKPRRRDLPGGGNTTRKLMRREIGGLSGRPPPRPDVTFCAEKFRRFKLQVIE